MTKVNRIALNEILTKAEARGREAFSEGRKSAPFFDMVALSPLFESAKATDTKRPLHKVMDAWARGWHAANLAV